MEVRQAIYISAPYKAPLGQTQQHVDKKGRYRRTEDYFQKCSSITFQKNTVTNVYICRQCGMNTYFGSAHFQLGDWSSLACENHIGNNVCTCSSSFSATNSYGCPQPKNPSFSDLGRNVNQILTMYTKKGQLTKSFCTRLAVSSWGTFGANVTNRNIPTTARVPPLKKRK